VPNSHSVVILKSTVKDALTNEDVVGEGNRGTMLKWTYAETAGQCLVLQAEQMVFGSD
jgi:hypothetical protein